MSEPKRCPFRVSLHSHEYAPEGEPFRDLGPIFGPCIREQCAMWQPEKRIEYVDGHNETIPEHCGLAGKP